MKKIYCGNLPFSSSEDEVRTLFAQFGTVHEVILVSDRWTGKPRGFGFVRMDDANAQEAIAKLNQTEFGGRTLRVDWARERTSAPRWQDQAARW